VVGTSVARCCDSVVVTDSALEAGTAAGRQTGHKSRAGGSARPSPKPSKQKHATASSKKSGAYPVHDGSSHKAPCGLRGWKNRPAPFPDRMS